MNLRKYWVQFRLQTGDKVGLGEIEISRPLPICQQTDLIEIAQVIANNLVSEKKIEPGVATISIIAWTKFEDQSIILASSMEKH